MQEPEEVLDGEHEQVLARVAAIDVAKASGMVCTRVPHPDVAGRRVTKVWSVSATTNAILELADHLVESPHRAGHGGVDVGLLAAVPVSAGG